MTNIGQMAGFLFADRLWRSMFVATLALSFVLLTTTGPVSRPATPVASPPPTPTPTPTAPAGASPAPVTPTPTVAPSAAPATAAAPPPPPPPAAPAAPRIVPQMSLDNLALPSAPSEDSFGRRRGGP